MDIALFVQILFTVIGLSLLVGAAFLVHRTQSLVQKAKTTTGTVVELAISRDGHHRYYHPVLEFATDTGTRIRFESDVGSQAPAYRQGQQVPVLYDPAHPGTAKINSFSSLWGAAIGLGLLGLLFSCIGLGGLLKLIPV